MVKIKDLTLVMMVGALLFGVGVWVGRSDTSIVHAQGLKAWAEGESQGGTPSRYELIAHSPFGTESFYAIRLDRQTGEPQMYTLGGKKWRVYPVVDER